MYLGNEIAEQPDTQCFSGAEETEKNRSYVQG